MRTVTNYFMDKKIMTEQELKITDNALTFFESLPDSIKNRVLEDYFKKYYDKLEDFIFYLECKERYENRELVGSEALFESLKERL